MRSNAQSHRGSRTRLSAERIMSALPTLLLLFSTLTVLVSSADARHGLVRVVCLESRALGISQLGLSIVNRAEERGGIVDSSDGRAGSSSPSNSQDNMVAILMTPHAWTSPVPQNVCLDIWSSVYQAIRD